MLCNTMAMAVVSRLRFRQKLNNLLQIYRVYKLVILSWIFLLIYNHLTKYMYLLCSTAMLPTKYHRHNRNWYSISAFIIEIPHVKINCTYLYTFISTTQVMLFVLYEFQAFKYIHNIYLNINFRGCQCLYSSYYKPLQHNLRALHFSRNTRTIKSVYLAIIKIFKNH